MEALRMKTTSMKMQPEILCLDKRDNELIRDHRTDKSRRYAHKDMRVVFGINPGNMPNSVLSYNATDTESSLFGIEKQKNKNNLCYHNPGLSRKVPIENYQPKNLDNLEFFERSEKVIMPEPLVIEHNQRPIIP